jgi:hypothetical protein
MLSLIMRHDGELFLSTPESEHPLNLKLELIVGKSQDPNVIPTLEHELEHALLWFFDLRFNELVDFEYAPEHSKFALSLVRTHTLNSILSIIQDGVTRQLQDKPIVGFSIASLTEQVQAA